MCLFSTLFLPITWNLAQHGIGVKLKEPIEYFHDALYTRHLFETELERDKPIGKFNEKTKLWEPIKLKAVGQVMEVDNINTQNELLLQQRFRRKRKQNI